MNVLENVKNLLLSPRFTSFYWQAGSVMVVGFLNLLAENIASLGMPEWLAIGIGLMLAQVTKAISNSNQGKPLGFSKN